MLYVILIVVSLVGLPAGDSNDSLNESLTRWVNEERFPSFGKITRFNINTLMETNKYLVMAVVEENQVREIPSHMQE